MLPCKNKDLSPDMQIPPPHRDPVGSGFRSCVTAVLSFGRWGPKTGVYSRTNVDNLCLRNEGGQQ